MFDDADWWNPGGAQPGQLAPWISAPGITPPEFYFGFTHLEDPLVLYDQQAAAWAGFRMDIFGSPTLVENSAPPYSGSHTLTTDLPPRSGSNLEYHNVTAVDSATPLQSDGSPTFAPVWQYMMTAPPALPRLEVNVANQTTISFNTYAGYSYQLQTTADLATWINTGASISGNDAIRSVNWTNTSSIQFVRLQVNF
jgi:hypothetical protein